MDRNEKKKDEINEPAKVSFGEDLRKARLKKNISLESIANITKIDIRFLQSIEEGNYDVLPQPYIRVFITAYASAVDLPPEDFLVRFAEETKKHQPIPTRIDEAAPIMEVSGGNKKSLIALIVFLLAIIFIIAQVKKTYFSKDDTMRSNDSVTDTMQQQKTAEDSSLQAVGITEEPDENIEDTPEATPEQSFNDSLFLTITALDSVWVRVIMDENRIREKYMNTGNAYTWAAANSFILRIGNGSGVRVFLNDWPLENIPMKQGVVENYRITQETLQELRESLNDTVNTP